tara:strand:- start:300 stop:641 length:342 start_codon:yes stop_codon:yes gene_type:complete
MPNTSAADPYSTEEGSRRMNKVGKPLTEVLAGIYLRELHKASPEGFQPAENLSDDALATHLAAMHSVVSALDLFNLTIHVDAEGLVSTQRTGKAVGVAIGTKCPRCGITKRCG